MKKQPELTELTKTILIDTYFEIISKGEKATVGAITERAGYNRCTFYRYFTDTEQLLYHVETEICDAFQKVLSKVAFPVSPIYLIESLSAVYHQYGNYLSVLLGENGDIRFVKRMKNVVSPYAKQLLASESEADVVTELRVEFMLSAVLAVVTKWYDMNQPIPISQLGLIITDLFHQRILQS